jgi:uncharacterized protein
VNAGTGTAQNVQLSGATLAAAAGSAVPVAIGNIAPGGSANVNVVFPANAGASGSGAVERLSGSYTGGSFGGSLRVVLP